MKRAANTSEPAAKRPALAQQVDEAVERIMTDRESKLPRVDSRIAALLHVASELRDLPNEDFKTRLKKDLLSRVTPASASLAAVQKKTSHIPPSSHTAEVAPHQRPGSIMPFMYTDDVPGAFELYKKVFGAAEIHRVTQPNGRVSHIGTAIGGTHVMLRDATTPDLAEYRAQGFAATPRSLGGTPLHLYIYVADADAAFKRALESGSKIVDPMDDQAWGDRCGGVQDPFGYIW